MGQIRAAIRGRRANKTAPGRGGGPGACLSEALGENTDPQGKRSRFTREPRGPSPLLDLPTWVVARSSKMRRTHAATAKTHRSIVELFWFAYAALRSEPAPVAVAWQACENAENK